MKPAVALVMGNAVTWCSFIKYEKHISQSRSTWDMFSNPNENI